MREGLDIDGLEEILDLAQLPEAANDLVREEFAKNGSTPELISALMDVIEKLALVDDFDRIRSALERHSEACSAGADRGLRTIIHTLEGENDDIVKQDTN